MASVIENWLVVTIAPLIVLAVVTIIIPLLAGQSIFDSTTSNMLVSTGTSLGDFGPVIIIIAILGGAAVLIGGRR